LWEQPPAIEPTGEKSVAANMMVEFEDMVESRANLKRKAQADAKAAEKEAKKAALAQTKLEEKDAKRAAMEFAKSSHLVPKQSDGDVAKAAKRVAKQAALEAKRAERETKKHDAIFPRKLSLESSRKQYMARSGGKGTKPISKSFKIDPTDEASKKKAKESAEAWIATGETPRKTSE